jgi:hypothetical protein
MRNLGMFLAAIVLHWKMALIGPAMTLAGLVWQIVIWAAPDLTVPNVSPWMLWASGVVIMFAAAFAAWRDEYDRAERAEAALETLTEERPRIVFDQVRHSNVRLSPPDGHDVEVWQLWFQNRPSTQSSLATAQYLTAQVSFCDARWSPQLTFVGQWAITSMPEHVGITGIRSAIDLPPVHMWAKLMLISETGVKTAVTNRNGEGETELYSHVYALAGENLHHDPMRAAHHPYLLAKSVTKVKVTLAAQNMAAKVFLFHLERDADGAMKAIVEVT